MDLAKPHLFILAVTVGVVVPATAGARFPSSDQAPRHPPDKEHRGTFVVDGSFVHDVGELQLNITNWGLIGSHPSELARYSSAPSAMWPAGSGVDYLFAAGLWIGGIKNGVPLVSTGQFENELWPTQHPLDTIYETFEGDPGGARYPYPGEDDDADGRVDEDPKNGMDDDGDGAVDEDFAAIGEQHFRLRMLDDLPIIQEQWPDHDPLGIEVIQESFQWGKPSLEDAIGFHYTIRNVGSGTIEDLAVGFFADPDIGPRGESSIAIDDLVGFYEGDVIASDGVPLTLSLAYMYDCDGDGGRARGYIGFLAINATGTPRPVPISCFRVFAATASFQNGGDPSNDSERYSLLTSDCRDPARTSCRDANDYRLLLTFQPPWGRVFEPGRRGSFQVAMVMGENLDDLISNASEIVLTYYGQWFDRDLDPSTGVFGRERRVCADTYPGSILEAFVDCGYPDDCLFSPPLTVQPVDLDKEGCAWINGDCVFEQSRGTGCGVCNGRFPHEPNACTGVDGREFNVRWFTDATPPPPRMRVGEGDNRIHVLWASDPELERDGSTGLPIFEAYRVWRADDWSRPPGTSVDTGPPSSAWFILDEFDAVDSYENRANRIREILPLGPNTGLGMIAYVPTVLRSGSSEAEEFGQLSTLLDEIVAEFPSLPPRSRIRYRDASGVVTPFGERFPELADWECCSAQLDTLLMSKLGLRFYEYVDSTPMNGFLYFYAVTFQTLAYDPESSQPTIIGYGPGGHPRANFLFAVPRTPAQTANDFARRGAAVYVVPNPATTESLAEFNQLHPNADDPTGVRVEFRNLPASRNTIKIFTLSGDHVATVEHDGRTGAGSASWNLVSRRGQQVASGIYLYAVESADNAFSRTVGRFVIIW